MGADRPNSSSTREKVRVTYEEAIDEIRRQWADKGPAAIARTEESLRRASLVHAALAHLSREVMMSGMITELTTQLLVDKMTAVTSGNADEIKIVDTICASLAQVLFKIRTVEQAYAETVIGPTSSTKH